MSAFYRFSPITSEEKLQESLLYLVDELQKLSQKVLDQTLPVSIVKVFAHYPEEYDFLYNLIEKKGPQEPFTSDKNLYVHVDQMIHDQHITSLGVRIVDPYRLQVGCGDYAVPDFAAFREKYITTSPFIRDAKDSTDMLEIWHPDFDVLGYVIPEE